MIMSQVAEPGKLVICGHVHDGYDRFVAVDYHF